MINCYIGQPCLSQLAQVGSINLVLTELNDLVNGEMVKISLSQYFDVRRLDFILAQRNNLVNSKVCQPRVS